MRAGSRPPSGRDRGRRRCAPRTTLRWPAWTRKLDTGDLRLDDAKNLDALHAAVKALGSEQEGVRQAAGKAARAMVGEAGNVRVAVGLLANTEMVRVLRILDSVATRDAPQ